jgi:glycosyltransferase involved in cell wall biosynthesis
MDNFLKLIPQFEPVADGKQRPFWSVMMPVYRPTENFLRLALESVLQQDEGPERMQIEVVDDCSPDVDVEKMVRDIGKGRVAFSRTQKNLGLAGCWNTCISRSRGKWVHILHQDDLVYPGFYKSLARADAEGGDKVAAAFCRNAFMEDDGVWLDFSKIHARRATILVNWIQLIGSEQQIQTPAIVVRRETYEKVGGFRSDLLYLLDLEMWQRISMNWEFWFEPQLLAAYRMHSDSETSRLVENCSDIKDYMKLRSVSLLYRDPVFGDGLAEDFTARQVPCAVLRSRRLLVAGKVGNALEYFQATCEFAGSALLWQKISLYLLYLRIAFSKIKKQSRIFNRYN